MLKNTFLHIPGIGEKTERWLWQNNILCWEDYLKNHHKIKLPRKMHLTLSLFIRFSLEALLRGNIYFFKKLLPEKELWRVYSEFKKRTAFLDIETTGLGRGNDYITVVGLFDGEKVQFFIQGKNMQDFARAIKKYSVIVTYNGNQFDLPFLEATFGLEFPQVHIDLRCLLKRLGYYGGLKKIEKALGIKRCKKVQNLTGYDAVKLWNRYMDGDPDALELLLAYNREDVVNLKYLMEFAYDKMVESLNFSKLKNKNLV
ncbi:MAG TPA: exonuclease [Candidatus Aerophobetes bacterium]|uniref:Exonuclease n=1 Tax=Aerophobetes bacterium TaxID=2030807 RepID=A0A7V5HZK4_UNCAE|nr:exonuclease [Candidatus Aerophobetes bacterium]